MLVLAGVALGAVGCSQTSTPGAMESALTDPLVLDPAPATAAASAAPTPAPAPTALAPMDPGATAQAEGGAFPNINRPPAQPSGTLLPEEERKRIIAELEALREGQAPPPVTGGGGGPDLATQAETHGQAAIDQIAACSQQGALQSNPACAPAD